MASLITMNYSSSVG